MSKYIKDHTLSIGFNPQLEQTFFDIINNEKYRDFVHSYFFSLSVQFLDKDGDNIAYSDPNYIAKMLSDLDTYNIPANLLFNEKIGEQRKFEFIKMTKDIINLQAVTCLSPESALEIKEKYPELEVHLSIRYFDWNVDNYLVSHNVSGVDIVNERIKLLTDQLLQFNNDHSGVIDVVNISGAYSFNDFELIKKLKDNGLKTKMILNEPCIGNKWSTFTQFPGYENKCCYAGNCGGCSEIKTEMEWLRISTVEVYKEFLKYYKDIDIFKLSSRGKDMNTFLRLMDYYTSGDNTKRLFMNFMRHHDIILEGNAYNIFLEYIDMISSCSRNCYTCQRCKIVYEKLMKENGLL